MELQWKCKRQASGTLSLHAEKQYPHSRSIRDQTYGEEQFTTLKYTTVRLKEETLEAESRCSHTTTLQEAANAIIPIEQQAITITSLTGLGEVKKDQD